MNPPGEFDPGDPALPVAGRGALAGVRASRNAPRRALVLVALHLVIAAHVTHFLIAKRTLSPVEPSEAMYTLELGRVNAGFLFLLVALAATLVFGRFVCGWGCHLVALQDFCGWLMKKAGIRPRPFRSRLLVWAPAVLAFYMFAWPTLQRLGRAWLAGAAAPPFPGFTNHLATDAFWATFPGPVFALLTFATCGFAVVYFLGAKGFCTYGCPYGALFGGLDRLSPAAIVVSDACAGCGHCTATCTSNVRVHEEVRLYGRVVDPGCMKCMDCVSVCPNGALSFGFTRPSVLVRRQTQRKPARKFTLSFAEEMLLAAVCVGATLAFRGLYDGPPLLMSVGLGALTAWASLQLVRLVREPTVRLQNLTLRAAGRTTPTGRLFALGTAAWLLFTLHSGFVQLERVRGRHALDATEATRADALSGTVRHATYSPAHDRALASAHTHFTRASHWGLVDVLEVELGLAWTHLLRDEPVEAEARLRGALELAPLSVAVHDHLIDFLLARGRVADAAVAVRDKLGVAEADPREHFRLAGLLVELDRPAEAAEHYRAAVALAPDSAPARYNLGGLLRRLGRNAEAIEQLEEAARLDPEDADTRIELGLAYMEVERSAEALGALQAAIALDPDSPESRLHLPELIRELER